ncbi:MAG: phenylacetate-CoA oxygenase subunit PaaC, partial [Planctomycetota bacterium]|nr:phenylacetate-CoA oxygenase subunit PaaC [Planctomycetota bacterium]
MSNIPENMKPAITDLILAIADDKLILGHRNSDWTGLGPILEEDIAFSSLAQDEIAHASAFYDLLESITGRKANEYAFGRTAQEYRCAAIVEVPDEFDWATAIARQFYCDHYDWLRLNRLAESTYEPLAHLTRRIAAEEYVHVEHSSQWVIRLGQGTEESSTRMQKALTALGPTSLWLFEPYDGLQELVDEKIYPGSDFKMFDAWEKSILDVVSRAGLSISFEIGSPDNHGGRRGV